MEELWWQTYEWALAERREDILLSEGNGGSKLPILIPVYSQRPDFCRVTGFWKNEN